MLVKECPDSSGYLLYLGLLAPWCFRPFIDFGSPILSRRPSVPTYHVDMHMGHTVAYDKRINVFRSLRVHQGASNSTCEEADDLSLLLT